MYICICVCVHDYAHVNNVTLTLHKQCFGFEVVNSAYVCSMALLAANALASSIYSIIVYTKDCCSNVCILNFEYVRTNAIC